MARRPAPPRREGAIPFPARRSRTVLDAFLDGFAEVVEAELAGAIAWPEDVPALLTGCDAPNAFFAAFPERTSLHAALGVPDPEGTFGPDVVTRAAIVHCNELAEAALATFLLDPRYVGAVAQVFEDPARGVLFTALVFTLQVFAHELGHGLDRLLLDDPTGAVKRERFAFPLNGSCAAPDCDTVAEDFADWISAYLFAESLEEDSVGLGPAEALELAGGYTVAWVAWAEILGAGGGPLHGFTQARQANMLCYVHGGSAALRRADAESLDGALAGLLARWVGDPAECERIHAANAAATEELLGPHLTKGR